MYNYDFLSSGEFELLAKDIMERRLGVELRTYTAGKDGGIDIRGFDDNDLIIQVKHYLNSKFSDLERILKKEVEKINKIKPKQYYLVISLKLTPKQEDKIFDLFKEYMGDKKNIVDRQIIDDFLNQEKNYDIIKKNYKLWFSSSAILDLYKNNELDLDSEIFLKDYKSKLGLFVFTDVFEKALNIFGDNNVMVIEGDPGTGKTTLSGMLSAKYILDGYRFMYLSSKSISDIKKVIKKDEKEIILLDNFLGQRVEDINVCYFEQLEMLVKAVMNYKNKKIILNTRSVIYEKAKLMRQNFSDMLKDKKNKICKFKIDMNKVSYVYKTMVLCNHLCFNKVPVSYIKTLKEDNKFFKIVKHKNFNPRIIEYVTREEKIEKILEEDFFNNIIFTMDNPEDIWKEEFSSLDKDERIFVFTLFTLVSYSFIDRQTVEYSILKKCFEERLKREKIIDTTIYKFDNVLHKLTDSLISVYKDDEAIKIGLINPSVEDYIRNTICDLELELQLMLQSIIFTEQLVSLYKINKEIIYEAYSKSINKVIFQLDTFSQINANYIFLKVVCKNRIKNSEIKDDIKSALCNVNTFLCNEDEKADLIGELIFDKDMSECYEVDKIYNEIKEQIDTRYVFLRYVCKLKIMDNNVKQSVTAIVSEIRELSAEREGKAYLLEIFYLNKDMYEYY